MPKIPYVPVGQEPTPPHTVALWTSLNAKVEAILNGRSYVFAWNPAVSAQMPAILFGKRFFFTNGTPTIYAQMVPGAVTYLVNAPDPVTGLQVQATSVRSYDHSYFLAAIANATATAFDTAKHIATVNRILSTSSYPPGIGIIDHVSLFEHSMAVATKQLQGPGDPAPRTYWLREGGNINQASPVPDKRLDYGWADFIIEGPAAINIPSPQDTKFPVVCFHNLNLFACDVTWHGGTFTLQPGECRTVRRTWNTPLNRWENYRFTLRYFVVPEIGDAHFFWSFASNHVTARDGNPGPDIDDNAVTAAASMQRHNVANKAWVYELVRHFSNPDHFAYFKRDPHELCDINDLYVEQDLGTSAWKRKHFDDLKGRVTAPGDLLLADFIYHGAALDDTTSADGELWIVRVPKGAPPPQPVTYDKVKFRGFADPNRLAEFAAHKLAWGTDANGNATIYSTDAAHDVWLVGTGTNLLKDPLYARDAPQVIRTAVRLDTAFKLDTKIFENRVGGIDQDIFGVSNFTRSDVSSYRLHQRSVSLTPNAKQFYNPAGQLITVPGDALPLLIEAPGPAQGITAIQSVKVADLLTLAHFGGLADANTSYENVALVMTPEGLVLKFIESVRADALPDLVALQTTRRATALTPRDLSYTYNAATDRFELKHCIRFRGQGFGYGQHGRINAGFFTMRRGRFRCLEYIDELSGKDGKDFTLPSHPISETRVRLLRQIGKLGGWYDGGALGQFYAHEIDAVAGGHLMGIGSPTPLDGLVAFDAFKDTMIGPFNWFILNSGNLAGPDYPARVAPTPRAVTPQRTNIILSTESFNALAQSGNQCVDGALLDWRALRVWHGRVLDFNTLPSWTSFGNLPMPIDTAVRIDNAPDATYWLSWFAANNVTVANGGNVNDFPANFATLRNEFNQSRSFTWQNHFHLSNCALAGTRSIYVTGQANPETWNVFSGALTMTMTDFTLNAPTNIAGSQGAAVIAVPEFESAPGIPLTIGLRTNYTAALKWLTFTSLRALVERYINFAHAEVFVPLALEVFECPDFARSSVVGSNQNVIYTGELAARRNSGNAAATITDLNSISVTSNSTTALPIPHKQTAFRLARLESEAEWKLPVPSDRPRLIYSQGNRTSGKYRYQPFYHMAVSFNMQTDSFGRYVLNSSQFGGGGGGGYLTVPPFFPPDLAQVLPNPAVDGSGSQGNPWPSGSIFGSRTSVHRQAGPRQFWEFEIPTVVDKAKRAENYWRYLNREESHIACQIVATPGVNPSRDFCYVPQQQWGQEKDWWLQGADPYLQSALGIHAQPLSLAEPWVPGNAPRRNISAGHGELRTVGVGVTILTPKPDSAARVVYDGSRPAITLP
jgi:hypothetical protein